MVLVLRLDVSGQPTGWLSHEAAALLYARDQVVWEAGDHCLRLHGGWSRLTGRRSVLDLNSIVAAKGVTRAIQQGTPTLTNAALFRRDGHVCMYCGTRLSAQQLTRDHIQPRSRGGRDVWENVVTACRPCNVRKDNRTQVEAEKLGLRLLAVPYRPNLAEGLILLNRQILADQMEFLMKRVGQYSRLSG